MQSEHSGSVPPAIETLVKGHRQFLSFLEARVESRAAAEDILQSAFVRTLERGSSIRDDESIVAWFYRVLRNAVIDHYRHRAAGERAAEAWGHEFVTETPATAEMRAEICGCVTGLVQSLKPEYREALELVDLNEGSLKELAEQAGISAANAAVRVHRARESLKKQVKKACGTCAEHGCLNCRCGAASSGCH